MWILKRQQEKRFYYQFPPYHLSKFGFEGGGLTQVDLEKLIGCTYKTIMVNTDSLEQKGLIRRTEEHKLYVLTDAGITKCQALIKFHSVGGQI